MLKNLRNRLILSHILPLLITLPLMGIGLIYVLETQIYLPALANEVENDAWLTARLAALESGIWESPSRAKILVDMQTPRNNGYVRLFNPQGRLLASNDPYDQNQLGEILAPELDSITSSDGKVIRQVHYSPPQAVEVIDAIVPVKDQAGQILGFVWVSYPFATFMDEVYQLRFLIVILLALGLLIGSGIGYLLAVSVSAPIRAVTKAISALAHNSRMKLLNVYGPEEIQMLSLSVNDLVSRMRELEQARQQLLANLVHELGRPLGALRSAITALGQGAEKDNSLYHDLLEGMDDETRRLQRLLNDLAGLHEHILGTLELDRKPIDLNIWLPACLRTWQAAAQEKGIHWKMLFPDILPVISGDPNRLAQVVGNLASNAVKFSPPDGTISVTTMCRQNEVGISILDSGPGMSPAEQEKIFQPFYRGSHGRRFPQGMGLGLSIARELTEAHGGHIEVESFSQGGSRFTIWLPVGNDEF